MKVKLKKRHIQTILNALAYSAQEITEIEHECENPDCSYEEARAIVLGDIAEAHIMLQDIEGVQSTMKAMVIKVPAGTKLN